MVALLPKRKDEIEPFILSALCSKLYNKAVSEKKTQLDPNDVDASISNIILEIYEEKVQSVFDDANHLKRFEEALVDGDGHRNRPKIKDLDDIRFTDRYQKKLEDAHLIRIDTYDDDIYIELIHDLLAKAINKKREEEEQNRRVVELERSKKRQKYLWWYCRTFTKAEIDSLKEIMVEIRPKSTLCRKHSFPINLKKHCKDANKVDTVSVSITKNFEEADLYEGSVYADLETSIEPLNGALIVVAGRTTYTDTTGHYALSIPRGNALIPLIRRLIILKQKLEM